MYGRYRDVMEWWGGFTVPMDEKLMSQDQCCACGLSPRVKCSSLLENVHWA
jgi:hypothetical protein